MEITVKTRPDIAGCLQRRRELTPEAKELLRKIQQLGVELHPLHPGTEDLELASYFRVVVEDETEATRITAVLRKHGGVEAAFVKPLDELP